MNSAVTAVGGGSPNNPSEEITTSSKSLEKLQQTLAKTKEHSRILAERFQKKIESAEKVFICGTCGKKIKSKAGVKRHWSAKGNDCTSKGGFKEVANVEVTPEDRATPEELELSNRLAKAREAAKKVAYRLNKNSTKNNSGGFDANRLMSYPIGNFQAALDRAETEDIEKFIDMKFDSSTAPKKILAERELKNRKNEK